MAGWSILRNGSGLDSVENIGDCDSGEDGGGGGGGENENGSESDGHDVKLRGLFDKVLSVFLKAIGEKGAFRPVPVVVDFTKPVDLFRLFRVVRGKGGYDSVSKKCLWSLVAKESGLGVGATAAVKLVYLKYLSELEQWLKDERFKDQTSGNGNFRLLSFELEAEFRDLFSDRFDWEDKDGGGLVQLELCDQNGGDHKRNLGLSDKKDLSLRKCNTDNDEKIGSNLGNEDHDDVVILNSIVNNKKKEKDCKRKRESLSGLLKWLAEMARRSDDPSVGIIAGPSKLKEHKDKEFWVQAIKARDVLLQRRQVEPNNEESLLQKKLKMHPSMYEDNIAVNRQSTERSRCSTRLPTAVKPRTCSCCNPCSTTPTKLMSPHKVELENEPKEEATIDVDLPALVKEVCASEDESIQKHVSVGLLFQANVPEWTGVIFESDSKWLGTQVWPMECREHKVPIATDTIGKGRPEFCDCPLPGSVECIRFHIAEARMKLKLELGLVFYHWKFDCMGEEVSLQWTAEEEKRFKEIVRLCKHFGDTEVRSFPRKTREDLVSYYYNVFLVQKRSYQNRVTPIMIDSDDDETEFGMIGDRFGDNVVNASGSNFPPCVQNKQCIDLE